MRPAAELCSIRKRESAQAERHDRILDRAPENLIATDDRPLASRRSALEKLYAERYDIYTAAAELRIDANTTPEAEADAILKELGE